MHAGAWTVLGLVLTRFPLRRRLALAAGAILIPTTAAATVLVLNPTLTAHPPVRLSPIMETWVRQTPIERFRFMARIRAKISASQQKQYEPYALTTPGEKFRVIVAQGYGRFSPLGPSHSHAPVILDWAQDRSAVIWLPWVIAGAFWAAARGRGQLRRDEPPTAWAILIMAAIAVLCVALYIPLAWDRYLLPIQPGSILLASGVAVAAFDVVMIRLRPRSRVEG